MSFSIPKNKVVSYDPQELRSFKVYGFEWIDNLYFMADSAVFLGDRSELYCSVAREIFIEAGWEGDGEIELLWLPPFVFPLAMNVPPEGVVLWHVKQMEDGVSFILSPLSLPFEEFQSG